MFTLKIKTNGDAFAHDKNSEIAFILRKLADSVEYRNSGKVFDTNGNTVGEWKLT